MLIRKQDKRLLATPLKWLTYLGMATVIIITMYRGIRAFDQITEDQDMETLNADINTIELIHTEGLDAISFAAFERQFDLVLKSMKQHLISEEAHILKSDTFGIERYFNETDTFKKCEFYHGAGPGISAAISYCEHRGFWGRITTEDGIYDIEKIDGDRHRVIFVDSDDEMQGFRTNGYREFIPKSDAGEPVISRRLSGAAPAIQFPNCTTIEMLLIQFPSIRNAHEYKDDADKLNQDTLAMLLEANIMFKNTRFIKDGVEFICFDLLLAGIIPAVAKPELSAVTCDECVDWDELTGCTTMTISGGPADFNGVYSRSDNQQCIDGMPYFEKGGLRIIYDSTDRKWLVSSFADDSRSDLARCTTDTKSRGYQKLTECIKGMWEYKDTVNTGDLIKICADNNGRSQTTVTISGPLTPLHSADLDGVYSIFKPCDGGVQPKFRRESPSISILSYDTDKDKWIVQQNIGSIITLAKCTTSKVVSGGIQDLRGCTTGKWKVAESWNGDEIQYGRDTEMTSTIFAPPISIYAPKQSMRIGTGCPDANDWFKPVNECETGPELMAQACWTTQKDGEKCWTDDTDIRDQDQFTALIVHYMRALMHRDKWVYDAPYGIRKNPFGYFPAGKAFSSKPGWKSVICDAGVYGLYAIGTITPWTFAHELGHNLGANHDQAEFCGEYGGDFGHIMGYKGGILSFSQCSVDQFYEKWQLGNYDCLWTIHTHAADTHVDEILVIHAHCGNGEVEGLEECDPPADQPNDCCDMTYCIWKPGCCQGSAVFECVEVRNEGGTIEIWGPHPKAGSYMSKEMLNGYVGYYGGCIDPDPSVSRVYKEMEVRHGYRAPFFLKHVEDYILTAGSNTERYAIDTGTHKGWNQYTTEELGKGWWIISLNDDVNCAPNTVCHGLRAEVVCISDPDQPDILPIHCDWRAIPQTRDEQTTHGNTINNLDLSNWKLPKLTANKMSDASVCYSDAHKLTLRACYECLHWEWIPYGISIEGAPKHESTGNDPLNNVYETRIVDLNGNYWRAGNEECRHSMPVWVKDFLQIGYDLGEDQWFVSYHGYGTEHLDFARCNSTVFFGEYQDLLSCTEGQWLYSEPHGDYVTWDRNDSMRISRQFDKSKMCVDPDETWIPDKIIIAGAAPDYDHLNGDYSMISTGDCVPTLTFVKGNKQIVYDSDTQKWTISDNGSPFAKCVSNKVVGDYQDLLSCSVWGYVNIVDRITLCSSASVTGTVSIGGAPSGSYNINGEYSRSTSDKTCRHGMPSFTRNYDGNAQQIYYNGNQWVVRQNIPGLGLTQLAKCNTDNVITVRSLDYQDLRSCTEGMWTIHKLLYQGEIQQGQDYYQEQAMTIFSPVPMKILDQWDVCMPPNGQRILSTISIEGAQVKTFSYDVTLADGTSGSMQLTDVNFNGEYTSIWNDNCGIAGEFPSFYKDEGGILEIYYNTDEKKWFVRVLGNILNWHDAAKCTASLNGAAYQDLSHCIAGKWKSIESSSNTRERRFNSDPTMKIIAMVQNTAWQTCLIWNPATSRFSTRHVDTISIQLPESSSLNKDFTGLYKGSYEDTKNRQCDPNGGSMPRFIPKLLPPGSGNKNLDNLKLYFYQNQWVMSTYDHDATTPGWYYIARCTADVNQEGWQDLRRCTEGTWELHKSMYHDPPGSSDYYPAPTMTIHAMYQSMSFNWISRLVDFESSFQQWMDLGCPASHLTMPPLPEAPSSGVSPTVSPTDFPSVETSPTESPSKETSSTASPSTGSSITETPIITFNFVDVFWAAITSQFGRNVKKTMNKNVNQAAKSYYNEHFKSIHDQNWRQFNANVKDRCPAKGEMCSLAGSFLHGCKQNDQCGGALPEVKTELKAKLTSSCSLNLDICDGTPTESPSVEISPTESPSTGSSISEPTTNACDGCLDWNGVHKQDIPNTISIKGASAPLNGDYTRSDKPECIGGMPYFTKGAPNSLRIIYDSDQEKWFVSSFDSKNERTDYARCDSTALGRGYQDLRNCKKNKWSSFVDNQYQPDSRMRITNMPSVKSWFLPQGGRKPCATIPETLTTEAPISVLDLWTTFWTDIEHQIGTQKRDEVERKSKNYFENGAASGAIPSAARNDLSWWKWLKADILYNDGCTGISTEICVFAESVLHACEQVTECENDVGQMGIRNIFNYWVIDQCFSEFTCDRVAGLELGIPIITFDFEEVFWAVIKSQFGRDAPQIVRVNVNKEAETYYHEHFESIHDQNWRQFNANVKDRCPATGEMCSLTGSFLEGCKQNGKYSGKLTDLRTKLSVELKRLCSLDLDVCDGTDQTTNRNVWKDFWDDDAPSIFGDKVDNLRNRVRLYIRNEKGLQWNVFQSHMETDACSDEAEMRVCWFVEALFDACDEVTWCGTNEQANITQSINKGLTRYCEWGTEFTCSDVHVTTADDSVIPVTVGTRSIFGKTDSKGDGFWSNHVYVALTAAISLLILAVCVNRVRYYLRNRRNQQQTANERNPAEYARPDEQDAVNDLSIEDVDDYVQGMDTDGENGARPNGENQPAVDGVARRNSIVTITLRCRN